MDVTAVLAQYEADATADDLRALTAEIDRYLDIVGAEAAQRDFVDLRLATRIADVLRHLIDAADDYTARERRLLAGAVRYFTEVDDHNSDLHSATGLEDDAEVLNAVCRFLGRDDLHLEIE